MGIDRHDRIMDVATKAMSDHVDKILIRGLAKHFKRPAKLYKFTIGPYQSLEDENGSAWLHVFVVARSKAQAIRLKKMDDRACLPKSIRRRRHKWFVTAFDEGVVVLA